MFPIEPHAAANAARKLGWYAHQAGHEELSKTAFELALEILQQPRPTLQLETDEPAGTTRLSKETAQALRQTAAKNAKQSSKQGYEFL